MSGEARVPPGAAPELHAYLLERDLGRPTIDPQPMGYTGTVTDGVRLDHLEWDYTPAVPPRALPADGFVVFYALADTADPDDGAFKLPIEQRSFVMVIAASQVMSYAIAGYRHTYQGDVLGRKLQPVAWRGVSGGGVGGGPITGTAHFDVEPTGIKDGVNTIFMPPYPIALDGDGHPMATLFFRSARLLSTAAAPTPGYWRLAAGTMELGEAPAAGDGLIFSFLVSP